MQLKSELDDEVFQFLTEFADTNFKRIQKDALQWYVKSDECEEILASIDEQMDTSDSEDSDSDDEMIQAALARRFKSESAGKVIEEEKVTDSEDEDVISVSRRMRHLYRTVDDLRKRVVDMEKRK